MKRSTLLWVFAVVLCGICLVGPSTAGALDDRIHISGYGNAHFMAMYGMVRQLDEVDPNDSTVQLREFSLFIDADVTEGVVASTEIEAAQNGTLYSKRWCGFHAKANYTSNSCTNRKKDAG